MTTSAGVAGKNRLIRMLMALMGAVLVLDALGLMGMGLFHTGILLPLMVGAVLLLLAWRWQVWHTWLAQHIWWQWAWRVGVAGFALWLVSLAVFFVWLTGQDGKPTPSKRMPVSILVLGSGAPRCQVSPTLAARLDLALLWAQRLPQAPLVVSGGKSLMQDCTEGAVMERYLQQQGLPGSRVIVENRSTSTAENLQFSQSLLAARGITPEQPLLLVTSDFHQPRARRIARRYGFTDVATAGAPTPLYSRYNAWLREYFAYISGWLLGEF